MATAERTAGAGAGAAAAAWRTGMRVEARMQPSRGKGTVVRIEQSQPEGDVLLHVAWDAATAPVAAAVQVHRESELGTGVSAIEALVFRYGESDTPPAFNIRVIGETQINSLRHISLSGLNVSFLGPRLEFAQYSSQLREMDLSATLMTSWVDVFSILCSSPNLFSLNLSRNRLANLLDQRAQIDRELGIELGLSGSSSSEQLSRRRRGFPNLGILALNDTMVSWGELNELLSFLPELKELYLSGNGFTTIELTEPQGLGITTLQLNNNRLADWAQVWKLASLCQLESLFLAENPFTDIEYLIPAGLEQSPESSKAPQAASLAADFDCGDDLAFRYLPFPRLHRLVLTQVGLDNWDSIDALASFPKLRDVKLKDIPLLKSLREGERRQLLVARLPSIRVLNGSAISSGERQAAEKHFLKFYRDQEPKPSRYRELLRVYGEQEDLNIEVDLELPMFANVRVVCQDPQVYIRSHQVDLTSTVAELRANLKRSFFASTLELNDMRLFFQAKEDAGGRRREEMTLPDRQLYTFNLRDGDEIYIERKHVLAVFY